MHFTDIAVFLLFYTSSILSHPMLSMYGWFVILLLLELWKTSTVKTVWLKEKWLSLSIKMLSADVSICLESTKQPYLIQMAFPGFVFCSHRLSNTIIFYNRNCGSFFPSAISRPPYSFCAHSPGLSLRRQKILVFILLLLFCCCLFHRHRRCRRQCIETITDHHRCSFSPFCLLIWELLECSGHPYS